MKRVGAILFGLPALPATAVILSTAAAQYVVSTMAGYIHFAEGGVLIEEKPFEFDVIEIVHLEGGQCLRTVDGRAEVMIMPGSFIRLGPGSELEMIWGGLLSAEMKLNEGSAVIDLIGAIGTDSINIQAGAAQVKFLKSGLYRIDLPRGGDPVVRVYHGMACVEVNGENITFGNNRSLKAAAHGRTLKPERFNDSEEDALDSWNKERGKLLRVKARKIPGDQPTRSNAFEEWMLRRQTRGR